MPRFAALRPLVAALAVYLVSRLLIVLAILIARVFVPLPDPNPGWDAGLGWWDGLLRWDTGWFATILREGYVTTHSHSPAAVAAFYPLYPLAAKAVALFGANDYAALLIVSNAASLIAALLLFQIARDTFDEETGHLAVAFLAFFPTSIFLSSGYSEALALALTLGCFVLLRRGRLLAAACCAGLALATRSTGIVLLPAVLWEVSRAYRDQPKKLFGYGIACGLLSVSGLLAYMLYLWVAVGEPLRFASAQAGWHAGGGFIERLRDAVLLTPFRDSASEGMIYFVVIMLTLATFWRRVGMAQTLYGLGVLLLPYLTLVGGPARFGSMPRFALMAFPFYLIGASLCRTRLWLALALLGLFAGMLALNTARFAQWHWVG